MIDNVDLIIIGGGIHGCSVAADAAGRGLKVALFEQYDLGSQTSNASTKLIHGGLRYLETGQYRLVYDCLKEQSLLLKQASHLVQPLSFVIPIDSSIRPKWIVQLGLFAYDFLRSKDLPKSSLLSSEQIAKFQLANPPKYAFSYYDCITDDHRLVMSDALTAHRLGAEIYNYTQIDTILSTEDGWLVRAEKDGETWTTRAKALAVLAGPWIQEIFQKYHLPFEAPQVSFVQGAHLIVPKLYEQSEAIAYQNDDGRLVFMVPYHEQWTMIGTTDWPVANPEKNPSVTEQERDYLLNVINKAFGKTMTKKDIVAQFAGIRCLEPDQKAGAKTSRESHILNYQCPQYGHRLLTLIGGKLTSARLTAEQMVDRLRSVFPHMQKAWTKNKTTAGGKENLKLEEMIAHLQQSFEWVPFETIKRFAKTYGLRTFDLLEGCQSWDEMGVVIIKDLTVREIHFLMRTEWACSFEDILDRRTRLHLGLSTAERKRGYSRFIKYCSYIEEEKMQEEQTSV